MMQVLALVLKIIEDLMPDLDESHLPAMVRRMNIRLKKVSIYHVKCGKDLDCAFNDISSAIPEVPGTHYRPVRTFGSPDRITSTGWNWSDAHQQLTLNGFSNGKDGIYGFIRASPDDGIPFSKVALLYNFSGPNGLYSELYSRVSFPPDGFNEEEDQALSHLDPVTHL
jgi:hypothetical protein